MDPVLTPVDAKLSDQASTISALQADNLALHEQLTALSAQMASGSISVLDELNTLAQGTTESANWVQPANAGDSGGSDPSKPSGSFYVTPGKIATFSAQPAYAHNNGYWYTKRKGAAYDSSHLFLQMFHLAFPDSASIGACEAFEFEMQQSLNGEIHDVAWQIRHPATSGAVFSFDKRVDTHGWKATTMVVPPATWKPGVMVPIVATARRNADQTFSYLSLTVAGKQLLTAPLVQPCLLKTESNYLSVGFQLDTNATATPYKVLVESFRVIYAG
jgi:hypothetical protein